MLGVSIVVIYSLLALISTMDIIETANYGRMICSMRIKEAISIVRPVYGVDEFTLNNFKSWENQVSNSHIEVIYSMQDKNDPSIAIARNSKGVL